MVAMISKIILFFKSKWNLKIIKKSKFLIIGYDNSKFILRYLPINKTEIISFKDINLYITFQILLSKRKISKLLIVLLVNDNILLGVKFLNIMLLYYLIVSFV